MVTSNLEKLTRGLPSGHRIGIVGGGQLAKMSALPALSLGCDVVILERNPGTPAASLATEVIIGDWDDPQNLIKLGEKVDVVTLENEFVDAQSLSQLEQAGHRLYPGAKTIGLVQDKLIQKQTLSGKGIAVAPFAAVSSKEDIIKQAEHFNWPMVLKARRNGYDGKGNATLRSADDIEQAWNKLDGNNRELYVEAFCPFQCELAVMVTRSQTGEMVTYPVVESIQRDHICHIVKVPATISAELASQAEQIARLAVTAIEGIGTIGVELFLTKDGQIILNEMAPRVHNSGHYTIEACHCSQFENHVRAILGLPLGDTSLIQPAAVMVNLLGDQEGSGYPVGIDRALAVAGAHTHVYGKAKTNIGRKMGHVTAIGNSIEEAETIAQQAAKAIQFGAEK